MEKVAYFMNRSFSERSSYIYLIAISVCIMIFTLNDKIYFQISFLSTKWSELTSLQGLSLSILPTYAILKSVKLQ